MPRSVYWQSQRPAANRLHSVRMQGAGFIHSAVGVRLRHTHRHSTAVETCQKCGRKPNVLIVYCMLSRQTCSVSRDRPQALAKARGLKKARSSAWALQFIGWVVFAVTLIISVCRPPKERNEKATTKVHSTTTLCFCLTFLFDSLCQQGMLHGNHNPLPVL